MQPQFNISKFTLEIPINKHLHLTIINTREYLYIASLSTAFAFKGNNPIKANISNSRNSLIQRSRVSNLNAVMKPLINNQFPYSDTDDAIRKV